MVRIEIYIYPRFEAFIFSKPEPIRVVFARFLAWWWCSLLNRGYLVDGVIAKIWLEAQESGGV